MIRVFMLLLVIALIAAPVAAQDSAVTLTVVGTYTADAEPFAGAAEIVDYDPETQTMFITNGDVNAIDMVSIADPAAPELVNSIDLSAYGDGVQSVAVKNGVVAAAVAPENEQEPGTLVFFDTAGEFVAQVETGALPDMVAFTPDGMMVLTANEGEPNDDYSVDPEGSISIVDISGGVEGVTQDNVMTASFEGFEGTEGVRVFGPEASFAQDVEPEYIAVSPDGSTAFVTLQENNAVAAVDIAAGEVVAVLGLGFKDHSVEGNGIDALEDGEINISTYPLMGMYQPDAIAAFEIDGEVYLITANEGDTRDYDGFSEEVDLPEDSAAPGLLSTDALGMEMDMGDAMVSIGARSATIWNTAGEVIWDSGDDFEQITAERTPDSFNSNGTTADFDGRSDSKGPEPEAVAVGEVDGSFYAFVGLERVGGIMIYDVTDPTAPVFQDYVLTTDVTGSAEEATAGNLGPEGLKFVPADESPTGSALVLVAYEVSNTTTVFEVTAAE